MHGHTRSGELADAVKQGAAFVVERDGRITGYTSGLNYFGHSVAESNRDLQALIGAAENLVGPGFLVPTRNATLFRWCLEHGLRVVQPNTLMSIGLYNEPSGAWIPVHSLLAHVWPYHAKWYGSTAGNLSVASGYAVIQELLAS